MDIVRESWESTASIPQSEASTSTTNGRSESGCFKMVAVVNLSFKVLYACLASPVHFRFEGLPFNRDVRGEAIIL